MKKFVVVALMATLSMPINAPVVEAGPISRACMKSPRQGKSFRLCRCIQRAANQTLSVSQQKRGAKFFRKPHMAQEVRQSDRRSDERLWQNWKEFGQLAAATCH